MNTKSLFVSALAVGLPLMAALAYDSSSYVQRGLIAQWDGIDNAGTGVHDSTTNIWKDLKGSLDMTLTAKGSWRGGNSLYVTGMGAQGASATPAYKTIEIVFKMTESTGRILFASGLQSRFVLFDAISNSSEKKVYFNAYGDNGNDKYFSWTPDSTTIHSAAATYTSDNNSVGGSHVKNAYFDAVSRNDGNNKNGWGTGDSKVAVGNRSNASGDAKYNWTGEIYAIRLYSEELTAWEIAANHAIDVARFIDNEPEPEYVQDGLIVQWDGVDNAGTGVHDPNAATWKNTAPDATAYDLTLTNSATWNAAGNALVVSGVSAVNANALPTYQTIEVVYKMTAKPGRILFNSGTQSRVIIFDSYDSSRNRLYFTGDTENDGSVQTKHIVRTFDANEICFDSAVYDGGDIVDGLFSDGRCVDDGTRANRWNPGEGVTIGGRVLTDNQYSWYGEVYAIRLYNRRLSKAELAHNNKIDRKRFTSLANYEGQDSLIALWDGEHNFIKDMEHNPSSPIWRDLKGDNVMTLSSNGSWNDAGNGLVVNGYSAYCSSLTNGYKTIEAAFNMTRGRIMVSGGNGTYKQLIVFDDYRKAMSAYFSGFKVGHKYVPCDTNAVRTLAATYADLNATATAVYGNGVLSTASGLTNDWSITEYAFSVGDRTADSGSTLKRPWYGEVYAIRIYDTELTAAQIAFNSALDRKRIAFGAKTVEWAGSNGDFSTKANWTGSATPRYMDKAVISSGTASVEEEVVGSLSLGADAVLSLAVPVDAGATPLTVLGGISAETGAGLQLDAKAFGKMHPLESITLVECEKDSTAALEALAANLSFVGIPRARQGTVAVVDGKKLVYTAPQKPGMCLIVR